MSFNVLILSAVSFFCLIIAAVIGIFYDKNAQDKDLQLRLAALRSHSDPKIKTVIFSEIINNQSKKNKNRFLNLLSDFIHYNPDQQQSGIASWNVVFLSVGLVSFIACYFISKVMGGLSYLFSPFLFFFIVRVLSGFLAARQKKLLFIQFPDSLNLMVRGLKVGVPLSQSIENVANTAVEPTKSQFMRISKKLDIGVSLSEALFEVSEKNPVPEYKFFAVALSLQSQTGGNISETLENLADTMRKRVAAQAKGKALIAEAKMSMYILSSLPFLMFFLFMIMNYSYISVFFTTISGHKLLLGACLLWGLGVFCMQALINKALS